MKRNNYYRIFGKNSHLPVCYYTIAKCVADAKIHFYCDEAGTDITDVVRISKKQYYSNK